MQTHRQTDIRTLDFATVNGSEAEQPASQSVSQPSALNFAAVGNLPADSALARQLAAVSYRVARVEMLSALLCNRLLYLSHIQIAFCCIGACFDTS